MSFLFFIWLFILSYFFIKLRNHYHSLISTTNRHNLEEMLNFLIEKTTKNEREIEKLKKEIENQIDISKFYLQKVELVRYNPFEKERGNQSFVIALLDREKNGLILNFIYIKEGLRVYAKKIKKGKGEDYDLSEEEKKAIANKS